MERASVQDIYDALDKVYDPETDLPITHMGLIYGVKVEAEKVIVTYTLTYPGCPIGPVIEENIKEAAYEASGIPFVEANLVWDPPWTPEMMSEEARLSFGYPI